jgi:hypothetical protein
MVDILGFGEARMIRPQGALEVMGNLQSNETFGLVEKNKPIFFN